MKQCLRPTDELGWPRGERSREVLRGLIIGAFAGDRSEYRCGESDDSRLLELTPMVLKEVVLNEVREIHGLSQVAKGI